MSTIVKFLSGASMLLLTTALAFGQQQPYRLGSPAGLRDDIRSQAKSSNARLTSATELKVGPNTVLTGKVNSRRTDNKTEEFVAGEIEGTPGSSFYLEVKDQDVRGFVILRQSKKGYKYYTENGTAYVKEVPIDSILCVDYTPAPAVPNARQANAAPVSSVAALGSLQSLPNANGVVLLDFDGQVVTTSYWNNGNTINAAPANLTDAQQLEVWELVSEDYRPFNLNITNDEAVYNSYPANRRMRCIFTPTNTAAPGSGGVAYLGSFNWGNGVPCWVFNGGVKGAGDAASHEIGHTFGLNHDGRTSPSEEYFIGHNSLWAPIMGAGYYVPVVQWSKGEYANSSQKEDDLAKIASTTYGVGYRTDDFGGTTATAAALNPSSTGAVNRSGVIERTGDVDYFSFTTGGGALSLNIATPTRHPNLDVLARLYNSAGTLLATGNPTGLPATLSATLTAGTYYVSVTGTGYLDPATTGYSNYGSLGSYQITGTVSTPATAAATVYKDCNYGGYAVTLGVGSYNLSDLQALGVLNDDISSLKAASGYEVILYKDINFAGDAYLFTGDWSCLVSVGLSDGSTVNLNDWTTSVVVRAATAKSATARSAAAIATAEKVQTGIAEESKLEVALTVTPNPTSNAVQVKAPTKDGYLYVSVFSLDGKTILAPKRIVSGEKIDLSGVGAGVYLVKVFNGQETEVRKIVKY